MKDLVDKVKVIGNRDFHKNAGESFWAREKESNYCHALYIDWKKIRLGFYAGNKYNTC